jgi:serine phosphatase RsbU (regulator of sigma subunit)
MAAIFLGFFTINFLQLSTNYPKGKRMLEISSGLHLLAGLIFLAGYINLNVFLYQIFNIYTNISILFISVYLYIYKKYKPAKLFLIAFSVFLAFSTITNLLLAGIFPLSMLMLYSLDIGSTVELILFSIALGDKINSYRKETLKAQAENLQLVKEQNVVLEHKVTERTLALNETNEELNATLQTIAKQRDNIISSINYALRIQNAIIPKESEIQKYFPDSFVLFRPKDIVSGDFYWFADKGEKKIIVVADCTGHGVSGAFMTMIGNNMLNHIIHDQEITQPNEILNLMTPLLEKTLLHSEGKVKDGMDISIISIEQTQNLSSFQDLTSLKVEYSGAMNPLYYIENQEFKEIKADKVPIGGKQKEGFSYKNYELQVTNINNDELEITNYEKNNNDVISNSQFVIQNDVIKNSPFVIYLCTDGFQDQFGGTENRKFMVGKFKKLLLEISDKPMIEQKEILETTISNWILAGNETQTDDICVLGIRL